MFENDEVDLELDEFIFTPTRDVHQLSKGFNEQFKFSPDPKEHQPENCGKQRIKSVTAPKCEGSKRRQETLNPPAVAFGHHINIHGAAQKITTQPAPNFDEFSDAFEEDLTFEMSFDAHPSNCGTAKITKAVDDLTSLKATTFLGHKQFTETFTSGKKQDTFIPLDREFNLENQIFNRNLKKSNENSLHLQKDNFRFSDPAELNSENQKCNRNKNVQLQKPKETFSHSSNTENRIGRRKIDCGAIITKSPNLNGLNAPFGINKNNRSKKLDLNVSNKKGNENVYYRQSRSMNTTKKKGNKRKFPGPAGLLPDEWEFDGRPEDSITEKSEEVDIEMNPSQDDSFLLSGPWMEMIADLKAAPIFFPDKYNIQWIKKNADANRLAIPKVPFLAAVIVKVFFNMKLPVTSVILKDPTGQIKASFHNVFERYPEEIVPGTAVVLREFGVLSPKGVHYLAVTLNNLVKFYSHQKNNPNTQTQRSGYDIDTSQIASQDYNQNVRNIKVTNVHEMDVNSFDFRNARETREMCNSPLTNQCTKQVINLKENIILRTRENFNNGASITSNIANNYDCGDASFQSSDIVGNSWPGGTPNVLVGPTNHQHLAGVRSNNYYHVGKSGGSRNVADSGAGLHGNNEVFKSVKYPKFTARRDATQQNVPIDIQDLFGDDLCSIITECGDKSKQRKKAGNEHKSNKNKELVSERLDPPTASNLLRNPEKRIPDLSSFRFMAKVPDETYQQGIPNGDENGDSFSCSGGKLNESITSSQFTLVGIDGEHSQVLQDAFEGVDANSLFDEF